MPLSMEKSYDVTSVLPNNIFLLPYYTMRLNTSDLIMFVPECFNAFG